MNQTLPSAPAATAYGVESGVGSGNSVITPEGVIRSILSVEPSAEAWTVNQRLPSGPSRDADGTPDDRRERELGDRARGGDSADHGRNFLPLTVVLRPVNHMLPSGPASRPPAKLG